MRKYFPIMLLIVVALLVIPCDLQAQDSNTIGIKAGGIIHGYGSALLLRAEYEHSFTGFISIAPSLNYMSYDYEDGSYYEEGDGPGVGCSVRFYPREDYQRGFWIGPGVTVFNIDWEWNASGWRGEDSFIGVAPALEMGGKIKLGDHVYFDPSFAIGYHTSFNVSGDEAEPQATTVFATVSLGLSFGVGGNR